MSERTKAPRSKYNRKRRKCTLNKVINKLEKLLEDKNEPAR